MVDKSNKHVINKIICIVYAFIILQYPSHPRNKWRKVLRWGFSFLWWNLLCKISCILVCNRCKSYFMHVWNFAQPFYSDAMKSSKQCYYRIVRWKTLNQKILLDLKYRLLSYLYCCDYHDVYCCWKVCFAQRTAFGSGYGFWT